MQSRELKIKVNKRHGAKRHKNKEPRDRYRLFIWNSCISRIIKIKYWLKENGNIENVKGPTENDKNGKEIT